MKSLTVRQRNKLDEKLDIWADGVPTGNKEYAYGDGTVLLDSATIPNAEHIVLPLDHLSLITESRGKSAIISFLNGEPQMNVMSISPVIEMRKVQHKALAAFMVIIDGARATLKDPNGNNFTDTDGQITLYDPNEGSYTLTVTGGNWFWKTKYSLITVQLFSDGTSKWKQYARHEKLKKKIKIRLSSGHRSEDIQANKER